MNNNGICCYSSFLCGISKYDAFSSLKVDLRRNILINTKDLQSENAPQNAIEIKTIVIEKINKTATQREIDYVSKKRKAIHRNRENNKKNITNNEPQTQQLNKVRRDIKAKCNKTKLKATKMYTTYRREGVTEKANKTNN